MFKKILGGICCFFAVGGTIAAATGTSEEPAYFILPIIAFFAIAALLLFTSDERQAKREEKIAKYNERMKTCTMKHVNGLPIAENVDCKITSSGDKFIFSSGSMNFKLDKSKITDICIRTDTEIQEQYVSSVGGAVGGAMLFGALGAMIGGRAKKKKVKDETHQYLIITYKSPAIKYIGFEIGFSIGSANAYVDEFRNTHTTEETYQL